MSTCRGAAAPHLPCTHGDACDWDGLPDVYEVTPEELLRFLGRATDGSDVTKEEVAAFLRAGHDAKTEARVLGWLSRVGKRARRLVNREEPKAEVLVRPAPRGRVTGWSMACDVCQLVAPVLAPSKRAAELAAIGHLRSDHESVGSVIVG